ncbi:MAG: hypothetical protein ACR2IK_00080 [Chloroflexota bacterium]
MAPVSVGPDTSADGDMPALLAELGFIVVPPAFTTTPAASAGLSTASTTPITR